PGYSYEQTAYCLVSGTTANERETAIAQLSRLPDVQAVATANRLLFASPPGNNVRLLDDEREQFNMADLYGIDEHYLALMEISIVEGTGFEKGVSTQQDMIVSQSFAKRIAEMADWSDGVVGKHLMVSEHGLCRVVGVYNDIRIGLIVGEDKRPSAMFYAPAPERNILIRFHRMSGEGLQKAIDALQSAMPNKDIVVTPYKDSVLKGYGELRLFRNSVMVGSLIALVLSLIGLLAYLRSEINRRSAEIALRKVNGATVSNVLTLFAKAVLYLAIPALIAGAAIAAYVSGELMQSFSEKIDTGVLLFAACSLIVLTITLSILTAGCWRIAVQNPVHSLKSE
ncbi:MAG: ABC transporter permease, partial [Bacteroidales bacterium]|nr:ABC transporter permease [Bacteroidales bacterium]